MSRQQLLSELQWRLNEGEHHPGDNVAFMVTQCVAVLAKTFGEKADDAFESFFLEMGYRCPTKGLTDEDVLGEFQIDICNYYDEWPISKCMVYLYAYGFLGFVNSDNIIYLRDIKHKIEEMEEYLNYVVNRISFNLYVEHILLVATARLALDEDRPLEPEGLALLGGATVKTIRNLMASGALRTEDGKVLHSDAMAWLLERKEFYPSAWRDHIEAEAVLRDEKLHFVPVAKDGSCFHPGLKSKDGTYRIGAKDAELQIADYEMALTHLQQMPTPHWRRPGPKGNWGIVTGVRWERLTTTQLAHQGQPNSEEG